MSKSATSSVAGIHVSDKLISVFLCSYVITGGRYSLHHERMICDWGPAQNQVLKSGSLNKKAQRTKRWIKHWFVLKNDALSWYQSSSVGDMSTSSSDTRMIYYLGSLFSAWYCGFKICYFLRTHR